MPAYAYPINIKRDRQKVRYVKEIELDSNILTLDMLSKLIAKDERFSITETHEGGTTLTIIGDRLETDEELTQSVQKEERYMAEYNRRKQSKK